MALSTHRVHKSTAIERNRTQFREKFLNLPSKSSLALHKKRKLRSLTQKTSKEELLDIIQRSARKQAARDRQTRIFKRVKRVRTKAWIEIKHKPRTVSIQFTGQMAVPQLVVTTPDGETRWLEDPNNYEYVNLKMNKSP